MSKIFNQKEIFLVLLAVLNLIIDVVVCCTLPPYVAYSVNSEMVVMSLSSSWLLLIYPAISVFMAVINVFVQSKGSDVIKNMAMIFTILVVSLLIYISVIKIDFASQGYAVGDSVSFPLYGITLFPVSVIALVLGTKNEKIFGAIFKLNENNKSLVNFTKKMLIVFGLILAILCILDFIFKLGIVVLIIALSIAVVGIIATIVYKKITQNR